MEEFLHGGIPPWRNSSMEDSSMEDSSVEDSRGDRRSPLRLEGALLVYEQSGNLKHFAGNVGAGWRPRISGPHLKAQKGEGQRREKLDLRFEMPHAVGRLGQVPHDMGQLPHGMGQLSHGMGRLPHGMGQ